MRIGPSGWTRAGRGLPAVFVLALLGAPKVALAQAGGGPAPVPGYGSPATPGAPPPTAPAPGYGTPPPAGGAYGAPPGAAAGPYGPPPYASWRTRSDLEIGTLYGTGIAYGVGVGSWLSLETGTQDPGVFLIAPAILGVAAPIGVYLADRSTLAEGLPGSIASGLVIGAGEGLGIAGLQYTTVREAWRWELRGFARATTLGATLGGVGGGLVGYYLEPEPESTFLTTSSIFWGTAIGSFFGYGASPADEGWSRSNDSAAIGGFVGYNAALGLAAGLGAVWIPSWEQLGWMWAGAGIGAAASLPVFLLYAGEGGPPAKRGFLFTGTATLLGLGVAALLAPGDDSFGFAADERSPFVGRWAAVTQIAPMACEGGLGIVVSGTVF